MKICLEKVNDYKLELFEMITSWYNDDEIKAYITPTNDKMKAGEVSAKEMLERYNGNEKRVLYFIKADDKPIGTVSISRSLNI